MFLTWRSEYWQPLETNKEFAGHFRAPGAWRGLFRDVRMAFRRFFGAARPVTLSGSEAPALVRESSASA